MEKHYSRSRIKQKIGDYLKHRAGVGFDSASNRQFYNAVASVVTEILMDKSSKNRVAQISKGKKSVNYLSMEFLMGRSLKTDLYNLGLIEDFEAVLKSEDVKLEEIYDYEPDAGLGNGGLGRLASCYMDALATAEQWTFGYSILYEYGIFKQKIVDGWQTELPDEWLSGGDVWLVPRPEFTINVRFGGEIEEYWDNDYHYVDYKNYSTVKAVPYDMFVTGYNSNSVSTLRLFKAESLAFDMESFNRGDYTQAVGQITSGEAISKVLYPNDNHLQGKILRLKQQYFLSAAAVGDIVQRHLSQYDTMDNFDVKNAIHINDTHPTLAIAELLRVLLDECGYSWEKAWMLVSGTFAYTNHTVMREALEAWDSNMLKELLPRIYQLITEIDKTLKTQLQKKGFSSAEHERNEKIQKMEIIHGHTVRMANLCAFAAHSINGVSRLHSEIIKQDVFREFYEEYPHKFKNVTNGIAYRRWLCQSNSALTELLKETIGDEFIKDASQLAKFAKYKDDEQVLLKLAEVKKLNKIRFAEYVKKVSGRTLNPDSIFDVQIKRLHEYKRQHLNALNIISEYLALLENPDIPFVPKTYIFAAKAAPGYYLAKQIIKLLCSLSEELEKNPSIKDKLRVIFMEDYNVTLSEILIPAGEISEQISLAGTEASGTGNMKLMLCGAVTLGTLDGANVEIGEAVGSENIFTFGLTADEVQKIQNQDYKPMMYYEQNTIIRNAIDCMTSGINGSSFDEIASSLRWSDPYMVLADFNSYRTAQAKVSEVYSNAQKFNSMSLMNIAKSGVFSADRSIREYINNIWRML
ncbi:MAG: glycogen/starch/alpha-glucan phosphorylase [Oscillospiraceae bacterium]|nr:glycogen/starch/alpha-glucan phosphorylase [Oscillospiraceae bacterium]